jgi:diadenosine tetraphosphate (Ap4A) HIT family hydrolase
MTTSRDGCLFCNQTAHRILWQTAHWYVRYDNYPATEGHVQAVPKRHVDSFFDLTEAEVTEMYGVLTTARQILTDRHHPDGWTIGVNDGRAAGRSIDHLHIHLIPRYWGDVEDPRGGIRKALPNCDPDAWDTAPARPSAARPRTVRGNIDKPHRCPHCHTVVVWGHRARWWLRYRCCRCGTVFARWPRLGRLLPVRDCNACVHPATARQECGTPRGVHAHRRRGEHLCDACRTVALQVDPWEAA